MSKYLAVIKDSFREALASRILWVVLLAISLLLAAAAPLGYHEVVTWRIRDGDVREWEALMVTVRGASDDLLASPERRIWELLDPQMQTRLLEVKIPGKDPDVGNPLQFLEAFRQFQRQLNEVLQRRDFYDEVSFAAMAGLPGELQEYRDAGLETLSADQRARFHRLLVEASFPELIRSSPPTSIQVTYLWSNLVGPFPLRSANLRESIQGWAVFLLKWSVGTFGVIVAILVTAPIIPQMFDPGALHLLLSKPVSRWLLFLAKFLGGCAFIFLAASYLILGLWLILGLRFGVWDTRLLLSIPIYLFVFAIYYSISAFVGVIWRSPIVSIALTVIFWGLCFGIGSAKVALETFVWNKQRIIKIVGTDELPLAVNELGICHQWNADERKWDEIFVTQDQQEARGILMFVPEIPRELRPVGPVYDPRAQRLASAVPDFPPTQVNFYVGDRASDWDPISAVSPPTGTMALFVEPDGPILAVSSLGLFRLTGNPTRRRSPMRLGPLTIPLSGGSPFTNVGPEDPPLLVTQPAAAAINQATGELAVYTRGNLTLLRQDAARRYEVVREHELDGRSRQPVVFAFGGTTLVLGRDDGRVQVLDANDFTPLHEYEPEGPNQPRFVTASPDGRWFAVVFHNGMLWVYDADAGELSSPRVPGQGNISSADFVAPGKLAVADRNVRLSVYTLPGWELEQRRTPQLGAIGWIYRYAILPLYTVFPKPGELDATFQYLLSGKETASEDSDDLSQAQQAVDPWPPVWSSAVFTAIVLLFACLYIEWQDF